MAEHRPSLLTRAGDVKVEVDINDDRAIIEFSTTSYAVLEREQRVDLKIKRRGSGNHDIRFRCFS
jgi:hypothetical protein